MIRVRVSPEFRDAYLTLSPATLVPEGAALVAEHFALSDTQRRASNDVSAPEEPHRSQNSAVLSPEPRRQERPALSPDSTYVMERAGGEWHFLVLDSSGTLQPPSQACARCHRQAASNELFGPPRSTPSEPEQTGS